MVHSGSKFTIFMWGMQMLGQKMRILTFNHVPYAHKFVAATAQFVDEGCET